METLGSNERYLQGIEKKGKSDLLFMSPMDGITWACAAQTDLLILHDEVRRLNGRLDAVCDVVSNAVAFGDSPEAGRIMEAVRGE